jgi:hypothetical protein
MDWSRNRRCASQVLSVWLWTLAVTSTSPACVTFMTDDYQAAEDDEQKLDKSTPPEGSIRSDASTDDASIEGSNRDLDSSLADSATTAEASGGSGGADAGTSPINPLTCNPVPLPLRHDCPEQCTGGCVLGVCKIACINPQQCKEQQLSCPEGMDCVLECSGEQACEKTRLACPAARFTCTTRCTAHQSCKDLVLQCSDGICSVFCGYESACEHTKVTCGPAACRASCSEGFKKPELTCGGSCQCTPC